MASIPLPALQIRANAESPLDTIGKIQGLRAMQQQQQMQQLQQQKEQIALADQQASTKAMKEWDGKDINELPPLILKNGGSANAVFGAKQTITKLNQEAATADEATLKNQATKNDLIAGHLEAVKTAPVDQKQQAYSAAMQDLTQKGFIKPGQLPDQYPGDDQLAQAEKTFMGQKAIVDQELEKRKTSATELTANARAKQADTSSQEFAARMPGGPLQPVEQAEMQDYLKKNPGKGPMDFAAYKASLAPHAAIEAGNGLSGAAVDQAAERYYSTGELPSMGMGAAGAAARKQVMNRAAELHPEAKLAANSAEFKANQDSLKKLQGNFDQVTAFENTAGKNLDQFLSTAKKVVDAGSPWVNTPLRVVNQRGLGDADQAAFNAARATALTEIAKVLNSSNASGVLSDSARGEVNQLIGPDATLKQIYSAANILKKDMANRHDAYQDQISDIKSRLGGGGAQGGGQSSQGAPAASSKKISRAMVEKAAKDHGVSVDEAMRQAQAAGYSVE